MLQRYLYSLNSFKMFSLIIKKIIKSKLIFKTPEKKNILVFDNYDMKYFKTFLDQKEIFELSIIDESRDLEKIYISFKIIFFLIKHILIGNFTICYFAAVIETVKPKNIVTFYDNNFTFYKINKVFGHKIKCTAIQNAWRDLNGYDKKKAKLINIDNYICFGKQTKDDFLNLFKDIKINNFIFLGSLRQYYAEKYLKDKKLLDEKKKYDLCFIAGSTPSLSFDNKFRNVIKIEAVKKIINFIKQISEENDLKSIICLKKEFNIKNKINNTLDYNGEKNFFENLINKHPNVNIIENNREECTSYLNSYQSKLVIGVRSTLLLENLAKGNKVLSCTYYRKEFSKIAELSSLFPPNDLISLYDDSYHEFKKRVLLLLSMPQEEYLIRVNSLKNYMINYDNINIIKEKINDHFKI